MSQNAFLAALQKITEGTLPLNIEPTDARLASPVERARLRRLFEGALHRPAGYVLPLARGIAGGWRSGSSSPRSWPICTRPATPRSSPLSRWSTA